VQKLGVRAKNAKQYLVSSPEGAILTNSLPESVEQCSAVPYVDLWRLAEQIHVRLGGVLFY
jgi:hypothetical protein